MGAGCDEEEAAALIAKYPCIPSLAGLQQMRNRLRLAQAGEKLMTFTAHSTGRELKCLAQELVESYEGFREEMCQSFILLARARYTSPYLHDIVLNNVPHEASIKVNSFSKNISGVEVLQLLVVAGQIENYAHLGIGRGGETVRAVKHHWQDMIQKMITLCQKRITFGQLDKTNKTATKQTTLLNERVIPTMNNNLNVRQDELEELKQDQRYRMKIIAQKLGENCCKGFLRNSLTGVIKGIALKGGLSCHPECPFDCPKIDPMSLEENSIFDMKAKQICSAKTESANRDKISNEDFSGCPTACIKMYEIQMAEEEPVDTDAKDVSFSKSTSPTRSPYTAGPKTKTESEPQNIKTSHISTYEPSPEFIACKPCREAKSMQEENKLSQDIKMEEEANKNKDQEEIEKLDKQLEIEEVEELRSIEEDEHQYRKKLQEVMSDDAVDNKVDCSLKLPIDERSRCPLCHNKACKRPVSPANPKIHATMMNISSPKLGIHSQPHYTSDNKADLILQVNSHPCLVDAQEETGLLTQSSVYRLEVNCFSSKTSLTTEELPFTSKNIDESFRIRSMSVESVYIQPCGETEKNQQVLVSNKTSIDEKLSSGPFCRDICPKVGSNPCPHCHKVYLKTQGIEDKMKVCSKTTLPMKNLVSTCSRCLAVYPDTKKGIPLCYSASTSKKDFDMLPRIQVESSYPKMDIEENKSICFIKSLTKKLSPKVSPKKKVDSPEVKNKESNPVFYSKQTPPIELTLHYSSTVCPDKKHQQSPKIEGKEKKSKNELPPICDPICLKEKVSSKVKREDDKQVCDKKEHPPCETTNNEIPCARPEQNAPNKPKKRAPKKSKFCKTESIKTSTITIDQKSKATEAEDFCNQLCRKYKSFTSNTESEKPISLEDLTIDEKGKVVIRKKIMMQARKYRMLSNKDVIEKGEEEFRKVQQLREAIKIPCTLSVSCKPGCVYEKATQVSVGQITSKLFQNIEKPSEMQHNTTSYNSIVRHRCSEQDKNTISQLKLAKRRISDGIYETNEKREEMQTRVCLSNQDIRVQGKQVYENQNNETAIVKSLDRPVFASFGVLDLPKSVVTSAEPESMSEEQLERIHMYNLAQSPAFIHLKSEQIKELDTSYVTNKEADTSSYGDSEELGNSSCKDSKELENSFYGDNEELSSHGDRTVKVAFCKKKMLESAKEKWAKILINSFDKLSKFGA